MQHGPIDPTALLPLYHRVYASLRDDILAGRYARGAALPSERSVMKLFGVARVTARHAIETLAAEGLIVRERGRGTFVKTRIEPPPLAGDLDGVIDSVTAIGAQTRGHLIRLQTVAPPAPIRAALGLRAQERVQRSVHVRSRDGVPIGVFTTHVPRDIARSIGGADIERAPMLLLLQEAGVRPAWAQQVIGATIADAGNARLLAIKRGAPLVRLQRTVFDTSDRAVEFLVALYRADRYEYRTVLRRPLR